MRLSGFAAKNLLRNRVRTVMTVTAVAVAVVAFVLLRTVITAWYSGADYAAKDRIGTRHKISFIMPLPLRYVEKIRANHDINGKPLGVVDVTWANWFGAKNPNAPNEFFATIATDPPSFLRVYDEIGLTESEKQSWLSNRRGAIVGDVLARKFNWKVGDKITLEGSIYPGNWDFEVSGIYEAKRRSVDRSSLYFHWKYMNETLEGSRKDRVGWVASRIDDPKRSAEISKKIDELFADGGDQTLTMSERQLQLSFMGMLSAILTAIDVVSVVILAIMMLILGNTIAMGVRERTNEYGVLRAMGFLPRHIAALVMGEAAVTGLLGGAIGVALSYPLVEKGLGGFLEENMGSFFPFFRIAGPTAITALVLALLLGVIAAAIPAYRASKLEVVEAVRRIA